ncbi:MAG TPA: hypothetical protein VN704_11040 [Verrucomicrobiae bacterium]|nr:hypothetical protein [Verrucomicrobiae bacterium]
MTHISFKLTGALQSDSSIVVQKYLEGKSMNKIVQETGISKGKVHYLITEWKHSITQQNIDEIRNFLVLVKKSNISIEQCAQGFRLIHILKNFGIGESDDNSIYEEENDENKNNHSKYNEFSTFIQEIYLQCKNLGIASSNIISWIKDVLDIHSNSDADKNFSNILFENDDNLDKKSTSNLIGQDNSQIEDEFIYKSNSKDNYNSSTNSKESLKEIRIPFISQISYYISQRKNENKGLENYQKTLKDDIKKLNIQKNTIVENLNQIDKREKFAISYLNFFNKLKKELLENHDIKIEDDIQDFSQLLNDFKEHGYNATEIIKEYSKSLSIKLELKSSEADLQSLQKQRNDIIKQLAELQAQVDPHRQTMHIYNELEAMKFGLGELKQLWNTIMEIADANGISYEKAVSKFIKDIEKNYYDKLGFEKRVKEMKDEVIKYRNIILSQQAIGPALYNLLQKGMVEQNIIDIHNLIETMNEAEISNKKDISRSEYWKLFTDNLKRYGDIHVAIKEQQAIYEKMKKEIIQLNEQKIEVSKYIQTAISFINTLNNQISYYKGRLNSFKNFNSRINLSANPVQPFIFIVYKDKDDDGDDKSDKTE